MQQNLIKLGSRPLYQLCVTGTHDAAMSSLTQGFSINLFFASSLLFQLKSVYGQLQEGSGYLDVRHMIGRGALWTGHYTKVKDTIWVEDHDQSILNIVDDLNRFISCHRQPPTRAQY